jgi:hypothetical protein
MPNYITIHCKRCTNLTLQALHLSYTQCNTLEFLCLQHRNHENLRSHPNTCIIQLCRQFLCIIIGTHDHTRFNLADSNHVGSCKQVKRSFMRLWSTAAYFTSLFLNVTNYSMANVHVYISILSSTTEQLPSRGKTSITTSDIHLLNPT